MKQERYINLFTDFGFKRVFGQEANKDLLIDFLNQVLPAEYEIEDLSFSKNEHSGAIEEERKAVFDLHCISKKQERFVVELQKAKQKFFKDRTLYYSAFPITEQAETGDWNFRLSPVFMIGILNFSFDESRPEEIRHHIMLRNEHCEVFYEKLHFIYLEVRKFTKTLAECENRFEKWLWIFKNLPNLEEVPEELMGDMLSKVFKIAELAKMNPVEQEAYVRSLKYLRDLHNVIDTAFEDGEQSGLEKGKQIGLEKGKQIGLEKGEQIGLEKGAHKKARETARKMKNRGFADEDISELTGLSLDDIKGLSRE